ncbi:unnamed protein product [Nesidiocoris tenuis]|uniref:Uncharacterized protein n=1 Tax=Nesidiocoris tenuis TaxID=355587 RepID=A0A6H5FZ72_9HEMI|nr:unnamed protein product [Nesidiocoris tenuis]
MKKKLKLVIEIEVKVTKKKNVNVNVNDGLIVLTHRASQGMGLVLQYHLIPKTPIARDDKNHKAMDQIFHGTCGNRTHNSQRLRGHRSRDCRLRRRFPTGHNLLRGLYLLSRLQKYLD